MAYTGKIRGMKEEGCQTLLETFVKLYIEKQFKGQEDIGTKVIETTGFKVDDRSDLWAQQAGVVKVLKRCPQWK